MRKSPFKHHVRNHVREGNPVNNYNRGQGSRPTTITGSSSINILKSRQDKFTIDEHDRKLKKIDGTISFTHRDKRVSGRVVGIRSEYYLVEYKDEIWKVDRHSIFSSIGKALEGAHAKALVIGKKAKEKAGDIKQSFDERQEEKRRIKENQDLAKEAEAINFRDWKKDIETEEKQNLAIEKQKAKLEKAKEEIRKDVREGPRWKRALKQVGKVAVKELKAEKQRWKTTPKKRTSTKKKTKKIVSTKRYGRYQANTPKNKAWVFAVDKYETGDGKTHSVHYGPNEDNFKTTKTKSFKKWGVALRFANNKAKALKLKKYQIDTPDQPHEFITVK